MTSPVPVREGDLVSGKYRVGRLLGAGGMGAVVHATHVELERNVALKFLLDAASAFPEVATRFAREARAAARIQSEHVARVLDVGALDSGEPYIVMEYLEGEDLQRMLERRGPLPISEAVDYVLQACEAVAEAHSLGIVHRDLKPANLFLARVPSGQALVKVLDFGISRLQASPDDPRLTSTAAVFGSPLYMSPEQMTSSASVDARSDIWSLGASLYELLTVCHAFEGDTKGALIAAVLSEAPKPLRQHRPEIPAELERVILRCLEKEPSRRFAHVAELAAALAPYGSARSNDSLERISNVLGVALPREPAPTARQVELAPAARPTRTEGSWSQTSPRAVTRPNARRALWVSAALISVLGGGAAYGAMRLFSSSRESDALSSAASGRALVMPASRASVAEPLAAGVASAPENVAPATRTEAAALTPAVSGSRAAAASASALSSGSTLGSARAGAGARKPAPPLSPSCARLLERQSLGEALTSAEARVVATSCQAR